MPETELLYTQMMHNQFLPTPLVVPSITAAPANQPTQSSQLFAQHALQKLGQLRLLLEKSAGELQQLECLINQILFHRT
jgi:hypothetical protein